MISIQASVPSLFPPAWAILERQLLEVMEQAIQPFLDKYTQPDGRLIWCGKLHHGESADDFYEAFYNWPLLYLLGGGEQVLTISLRQWEAVLRQLEQMDVLRLEYERGSDQFHQAEGNLFFFFLCLADPTNPRLISQARTFAGLFLNEHAGIQNYDPELKMLRSPRNGSDGPQATYFVGEAIYPWRFDMLAYGLPYEDVPGIQSYEDLKDPALARRMGQVMQERLSKGDVVTNLFVTSLITNAYLLTGEEKYRRWVTEYVDAWVERAKQNGGLLPDTVGLNGEIGEYLQGKWYGGLYGWTWPHGFYSIEMAALVAAANAQLVAQERSYLDLPRTQLDYLLKLGSVRDVRELFMSLKHHWFGQIQALDPAHCETLVIPYRYSDSGWFDEQPISTPFPTTIWSLSQAQSDWDRLEYIRQQSHYDWKRVIPFRNKEDAGHEYPWLCFLAGENPDYPETILREQYGQIYKRMERLRADTQDLTQVPDEMIDSLVHHWQLVNPVQTEAFVQLMLGGPQVIYNGGLLHVSVRYFDAQRRRPGLPPDIAALVEKIGAEMIVVRLVNISAFTAQNVIVQAGAFGEHQILSATYSASTGEQTALSYPGKERSTADFLPGEEQRSVTVDAQALEVLLPAGTEIRLYLRIARFVNQPSYAFPW